MRRVGSLAGLACALLLLVSCGGGDSTPQAAPQAPALRAATAAQSPLAANTLDAGAIFRFAESHYSQYFPGGYVPGTFDGYQYRRYALTGNYLGVKDGQVYVMFGDTGQILHVGAMASFECQIFPANCPVTSPPASDAVALSGLYVGTFPGVSPNALLLIAADGSFVGSNFNDAGTRSDVFAGTASAGAGTWSAAGAKYGVYPSTTAYSVLGSANFTGTFINASTATASVSASGVTPVSTQLAGAYDPQSSAPASLWIAGGLYTTPDLGQAVTIDTSTGALLGTIKTGCSASGTLSVPSAQRNVYKAQVTLSGATCPYNESLNLLGYYYTATNGQQALVLIGTTAGAQFGYFDLTLYRASN
jgi:hypothetical protein